MATPVHPERPAGLTRWPGYHWPSKVLRFAGAKRRGIGFRCILELSVILGLSVFYFFLVRNFALGVGDNNINNWVFTACGKSSFHLDGLYLVWKGRISGLLLSGSLFDLIVGDDSYSIQAYAACFGLYHAFWLLLLLLTILVAVRQSLLINLCIFAGLLYNFIPLANFYFFPWDLPATVFMTLAVLLFDRGHRGLMLAAICVGCLFKETVLVAAILCFFCREWRWRWRILSFLGLAAFYLLSKRYLVSTLHLKTAVLSMGDATNLQQLLRLDILIPNLKLLFSAKAPQVLFANAGTLVAVLVVGWQKRFRPYMWVILLFVAGQFMYGAFNEVRIFMQVLPLCCLMLIEYTQGWATHPADAASIAQRGPRTGQPTVKESSGMDAAGQLIAESGPPLVQTFWARHKNEVCLPLIAIVMLAGTSAVVAWDYFTLVQTLKPEYKTRRLEGFRVAAQRGEAAAQYVLGNYYRDGVGVDPNITEAISWYRKAAGKGHTGAQLALGLCLARGQGTAQNYEESISWFRRVTALGNQGGPWYRGLVYSGGLNEKREMVDRFTYLAWLGPLAVAAAMLATGIAFIRKSESTPNPVLLVAMVLLAGAGSWWWNYGSLDVIWQSIVACDPNYYLACENLGFDLSATGEVNEAIAAFQKAAALQPQNPISHYNLGIVLMQKGHLEGAIVEYRKAVELKPEYTDAQGNLGTALCQIGRLDAAIVHFRKAVESSPNSAAAHNNLGAGLSKKGQSDEAISQLKEALTLKSDFTTARTNLLREIDLKEASLISPTP